MHTLSSWRVDLLPFMSTIKEVVAKEKRKKKKNQRKLHFSYIFRAPHIYSSKGFSLQQSLNSVGLSTVKFRTGKKFRKIPAFKRVSSLQSPEKAAFPA